MILIQIILIVGLLAIGTNFISNRNASRTQALKKLLLLLAIPCAIFVVLFPSTSTQLANLLGVGRGADLLLYGLTIMVIFQLFNNYIKSKEDQQRMVTLARNVALMEAKNDTHNRQI